ncbi:IST1-like protein [Linum grandiflorum]
MPMLHKSFKPAKCKTALKMASSRIKLLRNKRDVQLRQLKREVAQLLAAGHDRTARIRVEHVVNEEKTMAAYDLLEIYCELIVARLNMIESQKICPVDLKEAISSVIFATPRCADLPELIDVKKNFTAKYGKDFVSAAIELRPNSGVSRLLVEKLSAKAPNGPEKMKILSAIAQEHNVKWDPESFADDIKPSEDLLNGPGNFQPASATPAETHNAEPSTNFNRSQASSHGKHDASMNPYAPSSRTSSHMQSPSVDDFGASNTKPSVVSHLDNRTPGSGPEAMEFRHPHDRPGNNFSSGSQQWNMEFKDATAAAQAAAESAERASMAARAAAELSSRDNINWQHSRESHSASGSLPRDEGHHTGSRLQGEELSKINSRVSNEQLDDTGEDELAALSERFYNLKSQMPTSESGVPPEIVFPSMSNSQTLERHTRRSSSESERSDISSDTSMKRQPIDKELHIGRNIHDGMKHGTVDTFKESGGQEESSSLFLHSHSRIPRVDENSTSNWDHHESSGDTIGDPFDISDERSQVNAQETSSYDIATAAFDDYGSDDDVYDFHAEDEVKDQKSNLFMSPESENTSHISARTNAWSPRQSMVESPRKSSSSSLLASEQQHPCSAFSGGSTANTVPSHPGGLLPVTFDDSDGSISENEEDSNEANVGEPGITSISSHGDSRNLDHPHFRSSSSLLDVKDEVKEIRKNLSVPSSVDFDDGKMQHQINKKVEDGVKADMQFGYSNVHPVGSSIRCAESQPKSSDAKDNGGSRQGRGSVEDSDSVKESESESGLELNFEFLGGGFRNKGYKHPPYRSNVASSSSLSKQSLENSATDSTSLRGNVSSRANGQETSSKVPNPEAGRRISSRSQIDGHGDSVEEQKFGKKEEPQRRGSGVEVNKFSGSKTYFDSDDSDVGEELSKQKSRAKIVPGSRRTKGAAANRRSSAKSSDAGSHPSESEKRWSGSAEKDNKLLGSSGGKQASNPTTASNPITASAKVSGTTPSRQDSTNTASHVHPGGKQASSPITASAGSTPSRQDSTNTASHVHPKLPDYDTFAAHLRSLRQNRQ